MKSKFDKKSIIILLLCLIVSIITVLVLFVFRTKTNSVASYKFPIPVEDGLALEDGTIIHADEIENYIGSFVLSDNLEDVSKYKKEHPIKNLDRKVDIDLTKLNRTMAWSQFCQFFTNPEEYQGKFVKLSGKLRVYDLNEKGIYKTYCLVDDAAGCCSSSISFKLCDWYVFPEDYNFNDDIITVEGTLVSYDDGYDCHTFLADAYLVN